MHFENGLTPIDIQRAYDHAPTPPPPMLLAGTYVAVLEAIDLFTQESVHPVLNSATSRLPREIAILGLYYRLIGFCRSAIELKSVVHQQTLTSTERSVVELYVDMALLHRDVVPGGVEKFGVFTDHQKLRAARRKAAFFERNTDLDSVPSKAAAHRQFIAQHATGIEASAARLWGPKARPEHWSGLNLVDRARKLGKEFELLVVEDYDRRNFFVHTGLAGVLNLNQGHFEGLCAIALNVIGECLLGALAIIGQELKLSSAIPQFSESLEELERVQSFVFVDKVLQSLGEPPRYRVVADGPASD